MKWLALFMIVLAGAGLWLAIHLYTQPVSTEEPLPEEIKKAREMNPADAFCLTHICK